MAFKEVQSLDAETTISLGGFNKKTRTDNPTTITGYYLGTKHVVSPKSKSGKAAIHVFQTEEGNVGVWGKTDLDRKMAGLANQLGSLVRVTQKGTKPTKGGNDMYMFRVEVDSENRIEVTTSASTLESEEASNSYEDETYDDFDTNGSYYEDTENDAVVPRQLTAPAKAAAVPDATRQAKVKAMLAKTKTA